MRWLFAPAILTAAVVLAPATARAQDARWTPWLGCWELVNENVRDATPPTVAAPRDGDSSGDVRVETAPRVCVERHGDNGVALTTTVPEQAPVEETIVADGAPHPVAESDCRGTESAEWSRNGQRLYARADVTCADGLPRAISGLALITPDNTWLDIRSFRTEGQPITRVSRYRRVEDKPAQQRRGMGSSPLTLSEISEAHGKVSDAVLEAAIAETNPNLPINKRTLVELADAGVSPAVLDLMVALAYPDHFVVERVNRRASSYAGGPIGGPFGPFGPYDYDFSGYYYPAYYYSPFAYGYIGRDPFVYGYGYGGGVPARPQDQNPSGLGRAIRGEGYTRIRPAGDEPDESRTAVARPNASRPASALATGGDASSGSSVVSSGSSSSGGGSSSSGGGSSSSGGGSTASPDGFSRGGDSGDGGRTAQPR